MTDDLATFVTWLLGDLYSRRRRLVCRVVGHKNDPIDGLCDRCPKDF